MNAVDALPASGLALFFVLGLRHGVEPDHIAAIDGMTLLALDRHEPHAPWTGSLFALGHGAAIAVLALAVSLIATSFTLPPLLVAITDWLPIVLLAMLGAWNLRALLAPGSYRPTSMRMRLIPAALRQRTDVWRLSRSGCCSRSSSTRWRTSRPGVCSPPTAAAGRPGWSRGCCSRVAC